MAQCVPARIARGNAAILVLRYTNITAIVPVR